LSTNNWLFLLEDEFETRQFGPSNSGLSGTTNENKHQSVEIPVSVNFDKISTTSNNKKRSYEELFGDISDFLDTNVLGIVID